MYSKDIFIERVQLALLDAGIVFATFLAAALVRHGSGFVAPGPGGDLRFEAYLFPATLLSLTFVILFRYEGLYSRYYGRFAEAFRVTRGATGATIAALALTFFYRGYQYSRATVAIFYPLVVVSLVGARSA